MFHAHTHTHTHEIYACACAFVCVCAYIRAYVAGCAQRTHSDRRDYEVGLRGEHISFLVIINAAKNVAKTCSAFGKYIPRAPCRVQRRSAPALSIAIYSFLLFLHPLSLPLSSLQPRLSFSFLSCCPSLLPPCLLLPRLLVLLLDHRRCCQTTCTPRPGQLPSCGHPFPSFSLSPSWVNPPPSAIPSHFNKLFFLLSSRRYLSLPSLPLAAPPFSPFAHPPRGCPSLFFFFSRSLPTSLVLLLFPRLSYLPLPARNDATLYQFPRR